VVGTILLCLSSIVAVMRLKCAQDMCALLAARILQWRIAHGYKPPPAKLKQDKPHPNLLSRLLYSTIWRDHAKLARSNMSSTDSAGVTHRDFTRPVTSQSPAAQSSLLVRGDKRLCTQNGGSTQNDLERPGDETRATSHSGSYTDGGRRCDDDYGVGGGTSYVHGTKHTNAYPRRPVSRPRPWPLPASSVSSGTGTRSDWDDGYDDYDDYNPSASTTAVCSRSIACDAACPFVRPDDSKEAPPYKSLHGATAQLAGQFFDCDSPQYGQSSLPSVHPSPPATVSSKLHFERCDESRSRRITPGSGSHGHGGERSRISAHTRSRPASYFVRTSTVGTSPFGSPLSTPRAATVGSSSCMHNEAQELVSAGTEATALSAAAALLRASTRHQVGSRECLGATTGTTFTRTVPVRGKMLPNRQIAAQPNCRTSHRLREKGRERARERAGLADDGRYHCETCHGGEHCAGEYGARHGGMWRDGVHRGAERGRACTVSAEHQEYETALAKYHKDMREYEELRRTYLQAAAIIDGPYLSHVRSPNSNANQQCGSLGQTMGRGLASQHCSMGNKPPLSACFDGSGATSSPVYTTGQSPTSCNRPCVVRSDPSSLGAGASATSAAGALLHHHRDRDRQHLEA